ncbi:MAG TPA: protein kinase [Acidimicrobiales bacterium]|jgi:adenylate cyclase|nr:protein kinase [Acidimicrobiales bacterium]
MTEGRDRVAQALPGYIVTAELGRGSFGVVWAAEHRRVGRRVAVKELRAADPATRERFLAEARVLALLEHPHVIPLYDYVEAGDRCLLVMERLDGGTLAGRFFGHRAIDIATACAVAVATCSGLHHAHLRGVLHRDVKPENLLFSADGVLKVTDFGVAKVLSGRDAGHHTVAGELKGTPAYMAPEQVTGTDIGPGVDIYATGLLLYELLTGHLPFRDDGDAVSVAVRRLTDEPTPLTELAPDLGGPLADVTMQALSRSPADRFGSAEEFGVAISRAATAALGAGWLNRSEVDLLAPGAILEAALLPALATTALVDVGRGVVVRARARELSPPSISAPPELDGGSATSAKATVLGAAPPASGVPGATGSSLSEATAGSKATVVGPRMAPGLTARAAPAGGPTEGERKHLTVLYATVDQSLDADDGWDPEDWATAMERFAALVAASVERFEGAVESWTDEGVEAVFGVPLALEDHGKRACLAALDIIQSVGRVGTEPARTAELSVCIGINSGEAVVEQAGDEVRLDPGALGRTGGLAQRMAALAEPGRIYLTEQTRRLVRDTFQLSPLGAMAIRGSREPVPVFVLEGAPTAPGGSRHRDEVPMVGREPELAVLENALALAADGKAQVVGVVAEAGAGKSRLYDEFAARAASQGIAVRRTTGVSHARTVPLLPVLALLRDYFQIGDSDTRPQIWEKVAGYMLALDPAFEPELPLLFDFLGEPDPERPPPELAPDVRMRRMFDLLRRITGRRSQQQPLVMIFEDLHWFDPQSVAFLERLVEWIPGSRTLVLTNFRPEFQAPWMHHSYYRQLFLPQLGDEAVTELLRSLLGDDPALAPLIRFVAERTAGNPFFVEEVVRDLVEHGSLAGGPGGYRLARPVEDIRVPTTVRAVLAARIDRLPADHKALLQTAAVIGRDFTEPVLARVYQGRGWDSAGRTLATVNEGFPGGEVDDLNDRLRALCRAEMLQSTGQGMVSEYRFWHPLTQEVAYGSLLAERRKKLHGLVAEALAELEADRLDQQAAVLAWHFEQAGRAGDAAQWHVRAARFALRSDLGEALRRWQQAVDLVEGDDSPQALELGVRARILLLLFRARIGIDRAGAERLYTEAHDLAQRLGDLGLQGLLDLVAGSVSIYAGDVVEGLRHYAEAARLAEATDDPEFRAALVSGVPFALSYLGPLTDALDASDRLQGACEDQVERGASVLGYSVLARSLRVRAMILSRAGRLDEARQAVDRATAMARDRGDTDTLCWSLPIYSHLAWLTGEREDTTASANESVRLAEETGNVLGLVFGLEGLALTCLAAGNPAAAIEACERALDEARRRSGLNEEAGVLAVLAEARLGNGDAPGAAAAAEEAVSVAHRQGLRVVECQARLARAQVHRASGTPPSDLAAELQAALELARTVGAATYEPFLREELGRAVAADHTAALGEAIRLYRAMGASGHAQRLEADVAARPSREPLLN